MSKAPWWREPTKAQWISFGAAWAGWVLDAFDFTVFLLVMPEIAKEFGVTYAATAASITLTLLFRLLGGAVAGAMADRWGRKLPLMISVVWFAVCDGAVALAPSFEWVLALRILFGFGMGAEWASGASLAMENWPARSRGIASGVLQGSWAIGFLLAALVASVVVPAYGWRALFVVAALPALLVLPIRAWVPESAEWEKAKAAGNDAKSTGPSDASPSTSMRPLLGRIVWASILMGFGFGAYYGLTTTYVPLLESLGLPAAQRFHHVELFNVGMMAGAVACGTIAARRGVVWAVVPFALLSLFVIPAYVGLWPGLLAVGAILGGMFGAGYSGTTPLLLTQLFPAAQRAKCVGIVYHVGAVLAAPISIGIAALGEVEGLGLGRAMALVAGLCQLGLVGALWLRPKTLPASLVDDPSSAEPRPTLTLAEER